MQKLEFKKSYFFLLAFILFLLGCTHNSQETLSKDHPDKWVVGPTQGKLTYLGRFPPVKIAFELECCATNSDNESHCNKKELDSSIRLLKSQAGNYIYGLAIKDGELELPSGKLMTCGYFVSTSGTQTSGEMIQGRTVVAGDLKVAGMDKKASDEILKDPLYNEKINQGLNDLRISQ